MGEGQEVDRSGRAVEAAFGAARHLILFGGVVESSPLLRALAALLHGLMAPEGPARAGGPAGLDLWERAAVLAREVAQGPLTGPDAPSRAGTGPGQPVAPWCAAVVQGLLADENPFTQAVARNRTSDPRALDKLAPSLLAAAGHDLRSLQVLAALGPETLEKAVRQREPAWPPGVLTGRWQAAPVGPAGPWPEGAARVHQRLAALDDWAQALPDLVGYWRVAGSGPWGQYVAFRWEGSGGEAGGGAGLQPVRSPDPTRLEDLVGYEAAREAVVENTERLVSGRPAHHLLLYGPRGTGKSATVRALVHTFGVRGLRLVELPLSRIGELPRLLDLLRARPQAFVILLDDLSLEPHDPAARQLKVAMEGTLEVWPENVRLYATSNRRHLVRESRTGPAFRQQDEIHEQISLADRFGVTVHFQAADQQLYLQIVEGLAEKAGIRIVDDPPGAATSDGYAPAPADGLPGQADPSRVVNRRTLAREARQWALWNNERSPRTAAQFVRDWLGRTGGEGVPVHAEER